MSMLLSVCCQEVCASVDPIISILIPVVPHKAVAEVSE